MAREDTSEYAQWIRLARRSGYRPKPMAAKMGISVRQLERRSRDVFGLTPGALLIQHRLIAAGQMLRRGSSVKTVAEKLGFSQISNFSREFRKVYGAPPRVFCKLLDKEKAMWIQARVEFLVSKTGTAS
jgi:AraC-like DNA-binding protein